MSPVYIVAITGASGVIYAKRFLEVLLAQQDCEIKLLISQPGNEVLRLELGLSLEGSTSDRERKLRSWLGLSENDSRLEYVDYLDFTGPLCSGSFVTQGMIVIPSTMATLAGIAHGLSRNLIERAADVTLKEGRPLILVPRETPLNLIHLRNMLALQEAGAHIVPAMPAFYHQPKTIDDLVNFVAGKVLDLMGLEHDLYRRWGSSPKA